MRPTYPRMGPSPFHTYQPWTLIVTGCISNAGSTGRGVQRRGFGGHMSVYLRAIDLNTEGRNAVDFGRC